MKTPPSPFPNEAYLAPYAVHSDSSRGRRFPEPPHAFRSPFQRDRDRIVHSRAFRRLEGKTQVFLNGSGDHYRTRLTHTIEVSVIARTLARRLRLNEDLTEAIALAHDLGHTPFGHMGERVLDELLRDRACGGFDHNRQALRVVDCLERKYPGREGLNLSWEVRTGLLKHRQPDTRLDDVLLGEGTDLEAQVAYIADDVAYCTHDLDDGFESGLLKEASLRHVRLWQMAREQALGQGGSPRSESFRSYVVRCLIDTLVGDILAQTLFRFEQVPAPVPLPTGGFAGVLSFSPEIGAQAEELRTHLFRHVYRHRDVTAVNEQAGRIVRDLFRYFLKHPEKMGVSARRRAAENRERATADYIAGMTDRYALALHAEAFP